VSSAPRFRAGGAAGGLKPSGDLDVGVLRSDRRAVSALVDTTSGLPAAAVRHTRTLDRARLQGAVANSGNANAATGAAGEADAAEMGAHAARALGLSPDEVAVASTGVIGERLDLPRVRIGIDAAVGASSPAGGGAFARAICTTDRFTKEGGFTLDLPGGGSVTIGAAAKGGGMISPTMATMLAYVCTDAALDAGDLARMTAGAAEASFNRITVDGQMSPSDTLLVLANGEGPPLGGADRDAVATALRSVCRWLAVLMVKDGEGAEHAMRILVEAALDDAEAEAVARAVGNSPLVKTAAYGRDANWGRVNQAVGHALAGRGGPPAELTLAFDGVPAGSPGLERVMSLPEYDVRIGLGRGRGSAELWASDLTHGYVSLNAEYRT
jgi:glutamate N-acetyltransferase/amino-acid N-acetyltransferase